MQIVCLGIILKSRRENLASVASGSNLFEVMNLRFREYRCTTHPCTGFKPVNYCRNLQERLPEHEHQLADAGAKAEECAHQDQFDFILLETGP